MHAENPLVVQIVRERGEGQVEAVNLRPVDRIEEDRAEQPVSELGALRRGEVVGQELGADFAEDALPRVEEPADRDLVQIAEMRAVLPGIDDIAADVMSDIAAMPLHVEEILAPEWKGPQHDDVAIHPKPAMLVEHGVAEDVAEVADLRARDDAVEQAAGKDV